MVLGGHYFEHWKYTQLTDTHDEKNIVCRHKGCDL